MVIVSTWIISYAVASPSSTSVSERPVASTIISEGREISGPLVSTIVTT